MCLTLAHTSSAFLCNPEQTDSVNIQCDLDVGNHTASIAEATQKLSIVSYNIDRNGAGENTSKSDRLENILDLIHSNFEKTVETTPDVILLQEVARDCYRFGRY